MHEGGHSHPAMRGLPVCGEAGWLALVLEPLGANAPISEVPMENGTQ